MKWELVSQRLRGRAAGLIKSVTTPRAPAPPVAPLQALLEAHTISSDPAPLATASAATLSEKHVNNSDENVMLADALNLLSPKLPSPLPPSSWLTGNKQYKPSLLKSVASGPLHEQHEFSASSVQKLIQNTLPGTSFNQKSVVDHLDHMLAGIHSSTAPTPLSELAPTDLLAASPKHLLFYIRNLRSEKSLVRVFDIFFYNNALTPLIMQDVVLNRSLVHLDKVPVQKVVDTQHSVQRGVGLKPGAWAQLDFTHLNILVLKKYHDLKKPLSIIRNLKQNFDTVYYPLIELTKLSAFYERIVWKFYFEYLLGDEQYYIQRLNSIKSTILIWESAAAHKASDIMEFAVTAHQDIAPHPLQMIFLRLCSSQMSRIVIHRELELAGGVSAAVSPAAATTQRSGTLSRLKQLSIKYKPYSFSSAPLSLLTPAHRSLVYQFIQDMESVVLDEFIANNQGSVPNEAIEELMELYRGIVHYRETELRASGSSDRAHPVDWSNGLPAKS